MGFKSKLPVFFLVFSLFVSFTLAYESGRTLQECMKRCQQKKNDYSDLRQCIDRCQSEADDAHVSTESSRSRDPRQELEECRDLCRMRRWSTDLVHRCEKKCEDKFEREQKGGSSEDKLHLRLKSDKSQEWVAECQFVCGMMKGSSDKVRQCEKKCEEYIEKQQKGGGSEDKLHLKLKSDKPQELLEECRIACRIWMWSPDMVHRCEEKCEEDFERQQKGGGGSSDEDKLGLELKSDKPQQLLEECRYLCRIRRWSTDMVHRCEEKCEDDFERQQRGGGGSSDEGKLGLQLKSDKPQQLLEECRYLCRIRRWSTDMVHRCEEKCEDDFERQQRGGGGSSDEGKLDLHLKSDKPQQLLDECRYLCRIRRWSTDMVHRCEEKCEDDFERQQRGGGGSSDEGNLHLELKSEKPQQELEECQNVCRMKRWSTEMVHRCEKKCEEKFERQQRGGGGSSDEISEERKYEQCQRKCEKEGQRGQSEQWQCQKRCQEEFEREGGDDEGERGHHGHDSEKELRKCRERCEEQGYGYDCDRRCRHQSHGGGRRSQDGFISVVSALFG